MRKEDGAPTGAPRWMRARWRAWAAAASAVGIAGAVLVISFLIRTPTAGENDPSVGAGATPAAIEAAGPIDTPPGIPPGRDDIPDQAGRPTDVVVIVDASETDEDVAHGIRGALIDLVHQLPEYDTLTLVASGGGVRVAVVQLALDRDGRVEAIEAIEQLRFGGARDLVGGVEAARDALQDLPTNVPDGVLIATGTDGSTGRELRDAGRFTDDAETSGWISLQALAVGSGEHEAILARGLHGYAWAEDGAALVRALTAFRLTVSEATLLGIGEVGDAPEPVEVVVAPSTDAVRFSVYSPDRALGVEIEAPSGRRYDLDARGPGISVQELGERATIVVNGAEPGTWTMRVAGEAGGRAWFEVEELLLSIYPVTSVFATGDTTADLRMGVAVVEMEGEEEAGAARIIGPGGDERRVEFGDVASVELNMGGDTVLGAIVPEPGPAGSHTVILELDMVDSDGIDRHFEWIVGLYVETAVDSDGDGILDAKERSLGLDPSDPADGAADFDHDGLSNADELTVHDTNPAEWDTDYGGESDGSEVSSDRDPLDERDDVPEPSCFELLPTPAPDATPTPTPAATPEPVPDLEAKLPDEVLGHATEIFSAHAPGDLGFFDDFFEGILICTGADRADLDIGGAVAAGLRNWSVVAAEIDGVSGHDIQDTWMSRLLPGGPIQFTEEDVSGRQYLVSSAGWATYATDDTFYWVVNLTFGDDFPEPNEPTPEPIPDSEVIIEAFVRELPDD